MKDSYEKCIRDAETILMDSESIIRKFMSGLVQGVEEET